ncbi:MAG: DUF2489 domain-containing protein [Gammaproteobacteria bacterium]|nr:DUF2489 domain-containing protein [Gammaproteobacteria bacterium]
MIVVPLWLLVAACAIILLLAGIAVFYCVKLFRVQKRQSIELASQQAAALEQRQRINTSIQILAKALLDNSVSLTEAAIRIRALLDALQVEQSVREEFAVLYSLANKTSHIPILQDWKQLPRKEKLRFEQEMLQLEAQYRDFAVDAAKKILGRNF